MVTPLLDLFDLRVREIPTGSEIVAAEPFELVTPAPQWSYAVWAVPARALPDGEEPARVVIAISLFVRSGRIGVGWTLHQSDDFLVERYIDEGSDGAVVLRVPAKAFPGRLMFRNVSAAGPSRFVLRDLQARLETGAPRYPVSVEHRDMASEAATFSAGSGVFDDNLATTINAARLGFLARLDLPLSGKRVLDAGCGVGHHTPFYLARSCKVVGIDGRPENIATMKELYPEVEGVVGDLQSLDVERLGTFDIVHCLGLLYHLDSPIAALRRLASLCSDLLILETMICDAKQPVMVLADEPASVNQALAGIGCRPSPSFVAMALDRIGFPHIYGTTDPPKHPDFQFEWRDTLETVRDGHNLRCMFVASRRPIHSAHLVELIAAD